MGGASASNSTFTIEECAAAYDELVRRFQGKKEVGPGRIQLLGWDLEYINWVEPAAFVDCGLVRRIGDFHADNETPLILDCGANIGCTVLNYKRLFPKARILAFEADPQFAPILRRNLESNGASDVTVIEAAAWTEDCEIGWFCEGIDGSHVISEPPPRDAVRVRAVDIARYLTEPVDLLKVDIEGAEYLVIPHLGRRLCNVKNILVECHFNQDTILGFCRMCEALVQAGFKLGMNTYGPWRDLIRQPPVAPNHWEQYILVSGWRTAIPEASRDTTFLPYLGIPLIHLERNEKRLQLQDSLAWKQIVLALAQGNSLDCRQVVRVRKLLPPFNSDEGFCWIRPMPELKANGDDLEHPQRSTLLLVEGKTLLAPAHVPHDDIRAKGGGRFSHWNSMLYFSSSDGSNPNTNGQKYAVVYLDDQVGGE